MMRNQRAVTCGACVAALAVGLLTGCGTSPSPEAGAENREFMMALSGGPAQHVDYEPLVSPQDAAASSSHALLGTVVRITQGLSYVDDPAFPDETSIEYAVIELKVSQVIKAVGYPVGVGDIAKVQVLLPGGVAYSDLPTPSGEVMIFATAETMQGTDPVSPLAASAMSGSTTLYAFYDGLWVNDANGTAINVEVGGDGESVDTIWTGITDVQSIADEAAAN